MKYHWLKSEREGWESTWSHSNLELSLRREGYNCQGLTNMDFLHPIRNWPTWTFCIAAAARNNLWRGGYGIVWAIQHRTYFESDVEGAVYAENVIFPNARCTVSRLVCSYVSISLGIGRPCRGACTACFLILHSISYKYGMANAPPMAILVCT